MDPWVQKFGGNMDPEEGKIWTLKKGEIWVNTVGTPDIKSISAISRNSYLSCNQFLKLEQNNIKSGTTIKTWSQSKEINFLCTFFALLDSSDRGGKQRCFSANEIIHQTTLLSKLNWLHYLAFYSPLLEKPSPIVSMNTK